MGYGLNKWARLVFALVFMAAFFAIYEKASAATMLTLTGELAENSQHSVDNPCIISGVNCGQQPTGFSYYGYNNNGGNLTAFDYYSPLYSVAEIRSVVGDAFVVGLDVNQTSANSPQTLSRFEVYIAGALAAEFVGSGAGNVPAIHNGSGYADYIISAIPSLTGFLDDTMVQFRAVMSNLNDGAEQFFLISTVSPVPLPAALPLFGAALAGMGLLGWRRRTAAA